MRTVSVLICTWNRAGLLDRTLARLHALRVPAGIDWELVVVNNGSADDTETVLDRHADQLPLRRVFEPRPGIVSARNAGLDAARGEILLWTDDDTLVEPDWLERYLEAFDRFGADLVFGTILPDWEGGSAPWWFVPRFNGTFGLLDYGGAARAVDVHYVGHNANMGFRRSLVDRLGPYRELRVNGRLGKGEDLDLSNRAHAAGLTVVYQPAAVVRHFIPSRMATKGETRRRAWVDAPDHYQILALDLAREPHLPTLLGMPRYFVRMHLLHPLKWLWATARRDRGTAFYYEVKLIRLAALYRAALGGRPAPEPTPEPAVRSAP